ncbi:uncharacterized protein LOC143199738 [Rhynchophorus ferrugineus]|uniref:Osiris 19 n=1 Tax=Rhynchophorus ferrugineus TaxID=354439 RepID=A0A834MIJ5_RHYFE|nr:hypothetical protein GWI33_007058 [Rhynchophorus ferrugineus]
MRALAGIACFVLLAILGNVSGQDFKFSDVKDLLQVGGKVEFTQITPTTTARSLNSDLEDDLEDFLKSNEISMETPFDSTVTFNARSLDNGELDLKLRLGSGNAVEARKKSKIKKILAPILIIVLLKAITLIPLALGILGLKTWNALQLSFVSFVTSIVLAVWKLCSKFSDHHHAPHVIHEAVHDVHVPHPIVHHDHHDDHHHDHWDHYHRSDDAQQLAYSGYIPENRM